MDAFAAARRRREQAAETYRPRHVRLLLIAEAPPSSLDRYFYFDEVPGYDSLFRYVVKTVLAEEPSRVGKPAQLARLRQTGVFLLDLKPDPKVGNERLDSCVPNLVRRAAALAPDHVITIKANVCTLCQEPLRQAGLQVATELVPFPGSGQQLRFEAAMGAALRSIGWSVES